MPLEITFFLQRHLDGALWRANQQGNLHSCLECFRFHFQRWRHGGILQCGSHGQQIWQVGKTPIVAEFSVSVVVLIETTRIVFVLTL